MKTLAYRFIKIIQYTLLVYILLQVKNNIVLQLHILQKFVPNGLQI
jgi:hypothetical protein